VAFMPGASPPLVRMPNAVEGAGSIVSLSLLRDPCRRPGQTGRMARTQD
jgi:hypothetical protein